MAAKAYRPPSIDQRTSQHRPTEIRASTNYGHSEAAKLHGAALVPTVLADCPAHDPESPCPTPAEPLFRDVAIYDGSDRRRSETVAVTASRRRVFERTFRVPPGGDAGTDAAVFTTQVEHLVEGRLESGVSASLAVTPTDPAWRFYNGVAVDVAAGPEGADLLDVRQPHGERLAPPC